MKKIFWCLTALLGLSLLTACIQVVKSTVYNRDVTEFAEWLADSDLVLVDVRTAQEYADGHIEGAINIDLADEKGFVTKIQNTYPKEQKIAVYCEDGDRAQQAATKLAHSGYSVLKLDGGIKAWKEANMPVVTP